MSEYYKLVDRKPVKCAMMDMEDDRAVGRANIGKTLISTVFLAIDHNWHAGGTPILFETMIFGGQFNGYQERYSTWEEAEAGHQIAITKVLDVTNPVIIIWYLLKRLFKKTNS